MHVAGGIAGYVQSRVDWNARHIQYIKPRIFQGIKQNYLYRVLPGLAEDGLVVKDGRGWKPKDAF